MKKHWYTSRQVGSQVQIADSTAPEDSLSEESTAQLRSLYGNVAVEVLPVEQHQYNKDDALLALAFATSFLLNQDPSCLQFYGMQSHIQSGLEARQMIPFPLKKKRGKIAKSHYITL